VALRIVSEWARVPMEIVATLPATAYLELKNLVIAREEWIVGKIES